MSTLKVKMGSINSQLNVFLLYLSCMLVDIIPTKKLPRSLSILSYRLPAELASQIQIGQLVNIPLRHSQTQGVVADINKKSRAFYKLKNINYLVNPKPLFTPQQLKLFSQLAESYFTSASLFVHFNLPKLTKKDWQNLPLITSNKPTTGKPQNQYVWWTKPSQRVDFYRQQIKKFQQRKQQLLIIVPQIKNIYELASALGLNNSFTAVHRQLSRKENFAVWVKALSQTNGIFIGTRSALFYPYTRLGAIMIDEENSADHKQYDMNPRYDVQTVSQLMQKIYKCHVYASSYAPSVKMFHQLQPRPKNKKLPAQAIELINIHHLLASKNFSFVSHRLQTYLKEIVKNKQSAFIFINHKGEARLTKCSDCGYTFNCPHCQLPLIKQDNQLICYYCQYQEELPPFCPRCQGPHLKHSGLGVQKIARQLKQLLPSVAIKIIDKNSQLKTKNGQPQIIVGTQFALDKINWPQIKLVGIINADQLWQHAEFMASEQAYQLLIKILTLAPTNAKIVLQTFTPEHSIIKALIKQRPLMFYRAELAIRKSFNYPPYSYLIKVSYLNQDRDKALKTLKKVYQAIQKTSATAQLSINPPMPILRNKIRGKYKFNLIIKVKKLIYFKNIIGHIPNDCLIDVQPIKLLD